VAATLLALVIDCADPKALAEFWAMALSREVMERNRDEFQVGDEASGTPLYFMKVPEPKLGKNRLHVDVLASGTMADEVARLVAAGASVIDIRHDQESLDNPDSWTVMQDPEGNEFCIIDPATFTGWT
jgi:hypothetical protein